MVEVYGKVYKETNYSVFRRLQGNRDVTAQRVAKIKASIEKVGYIPSPIIVNEKMEVIDGQGRLEACRELGKPVYYVIVCGIGIEECIAMNINQNNWKPIDYAKSYAEQGIISYKFLIALAEQFPEYNILFISCCIKKGIATHRNNPAVVNGNFKCTEKEYNAAVEKLSWLRKWNDLIRTIGGHSEYYFNALTYCYDFDGIDNNELLKRGEEGKSTMISVGTTADAIQQLEKVYNARRRNRVDLLIKFCQDSGMHGREKANRALIRKTLETR